jgi:hypothetical protein
VEAGEDLEVLPDDLPALPELESPGVPAEAEAPASQELVVLDEPATLPGGDGPADFEITGGLSPQESPAEPSKEGLEIGGLDGSPEERVPIETPAEDLFDRNYKDLSPATEDITIDLEVGKEKKGK